MSKDKGKVNYRETPLWSDAKAFVLEVYRVTSNWPDEGQDLAKDLRLIARTVARTVPGAFKRGGINFPLQMARGTFGELEALLEVAVALGFLEPTSSNGLRDLASPIEAKFRELVSEAKKRESEMMRNRTSLFGGGGFDDDDDDY